jgi:hypothetical protein
VSDVQVTQFAWDGANMIAEYDSLSALLRRYVYGPGNGPIVCTKAPARLRDQQCSTLLGITRDNWREPGP